MKYIVFDLEWNQSEGGSREAPPAFFEIIEIGAVMLDDTYVITHEFSRLVKPQIYQKMNQATSRLIHLQMQELQDGKPFVEAAAEFLKWCGGGDSIFCTWGGMDLTQLQRNMQFYNMTPVSDGPVAFLDVQKLFSLAFEDGKSRRSLEHAVDALEIEKDIPFHRASSDAYYTAKVLKVIADRHREILQYLSFDLFHLPPEKEREIKARFDTYAKYISREFKSREDALADGEVLSCRCYLCNRDLKQTLKWFTLNGRHYYCLGHCEEHGILKAKIRIQKSESEKVYVVKTSKFILQEETAKLKNRAALANHAAKRSAVVKRRRRKKRAQADSKSHSQKS